MSRFKLEITVDTNKEISEEDIKGGYFSSAISGISDILGDTNEIVNFRVMGVEPVQEGVVMDGLCFLMGSDIDSSFPLRLKIENYSAYTSFIEKMLVLYIMCCLKVIDCQRDVHFVMELQDTLGKENAV